MTRNNGEMTIPELFTAACTISTATAADVGLGSMALDAALEQYGPAERAHIGLFWMMQVLQIPVEELERLRSAS